MRAGQRARGEEEGGERGAHLDLGTGLVELCLAPRDDGDVCTTLCELAGEREAQSFGPSSDVAVLHSLVSTKGQLPGDLCLTTVGGISPVRTLSRTSKRRLPHPKSVIRRDPDARTTRAVTARARVGWLVPN